MEKEQHLLLDNKMENLTQKMDEGFKAINARLDVANGRTGKNEGRITALERLMYLGIGGGSVFLLLPTLSAIINKLTN